MSHVCPDAWTKDRRFSGASGQHRTGTPLIVSANLGLCQPIPAGSISGKPEDACLLLLVARCRNTLPEIT